MNRNTLINELAQYQIAKKARIWKLIPLAGRSRFSTTFGEKIYLTPKRYEDWHREPPKNSTIALLAHEAVHVEQSRREKDFKRRYLKDRNYRLKMEAEAYAKQAYIREVLGTSRGVEYYLKKYSNTLTSNYLLRMSFQTVYKAVTEEYHKLKQGDKDK